MSLLLDALKRAEQEKLAKQGERPANDAAAPGPEIVPTKRESAKAASLELHPLASAQATGASAAPSAAQARAAGTATAQAVFQAKAAAPKEGARNMTMLWIIGAVIVVAVLGIGGYVWWSLSALQPKITTLRPRVASAP